MSGEKHLVTVGSHEVDEYTARGYEKSHLSAREAIGAELFELVDKQTQDSLVVMQIDKAKHEAMSRLPQQFMLELPVAVFATNASATRFDVMESGDLVSVVTRADQDRGPEEVRSSDLHATAREAVLGGRHRILAEIESHRAAADGLENFLKRMEAM